MTLAPNVPQYMRRVVLDPIPELSAIRDSIGVQKIVTPLGLPAYLVTRYDDVKAALADPEPARCSQSPQTHLTHVYHRRGLKTAMATVRQWRRRNGLRR